MSLYNWGIIIMIFTDCDVGIAVAIHKSQSVRILRVIFMGRKRLKGWGIHDIVYHVYSLCSSELVDNNWWSSATHRRRSGVQRAVTEMSHAVNIRRWTNVVLMLGQRRRRWPNNKTTLGQRLVFPRVMSTCFIGCIAGARQGHLYYTCSVCAVRFVGWVSNFTSSLSGLGTSNRRQLELILTLSARGRL